MYGRRVPHRSSFTDFFVVLTTLFSYRVYVASNGMMICESEINIYETSLGQDSRRLGPGPFKYEKVVLSLRQRRSVHRVIPGTVSKMSTVYSEM
jgi:hypothetical protein